jgi:hypothetical protein
MPTLLQDDFTGAVLDTNKWTVRVVGDGSVSVNDVLQLNTGSSNHTGTHIYSGAIIPKALVWRVWYGFSLRMGSQVSYNDRSH